MIKVVHISSDTNIGGAGKCILTMLEHFDRSQFDMSVILPTDSELKQYMSNVSVYEVAAMKDKSLDIKAVGAIKALLDCIKPDIIHCHASMSARIAGRIGGKCKIVYTRHSVFEPPALISKGIGKWINGAVNNFLSDGIIAVAEAAKQNLVDVGVDAKKITVILNGITPLQPMDDAQKKEVRRKLSIQDQDKVVSIVARLEEVKGHKYFIQAAKMIADKDPNVKFIIAGTGSEEGRLKQLAEQLGVAVIFTGFLKDVSGVMNITDIQLNCSHGTEATSLALLEGMSLGIPAVVTDFGGNTGVINNGQNGFVVPIKDSAAIADRVCRLLSDSHLYSRMQRGSAEIFGKTFTARAMTNNTQNYYKALLGKNFG